MDRLGYIEHLFVLVAEETKLTLDEVKLAVTILTRDDIGMVRVWILASFDARGYPRPRY